MSENGYWFKSSRFEIEPGEDDEINPQIYGKQLAIWLKARLEERGYQVESIINEDWGRCLMCSRDPFLLWVGCGNVSDNIPASQDNNLPLKEDVLWHCFINADVFFWKRWFHKIDTATAVAKLDADLASILAAEKHITLTDNMGSPI